MDELIIYKRPLTADEMQELYLSASTAMHLRLDDPPGSQSFENGVDVSRQGNAFCTSPLAGGTEGGVPHLWRQRAHQLGRPVRRHERRPHQHPDHRPVQ
jgi:hypothetical protein